MRTKKEKSNNLIINEYIPLCVRFHKIYTDYTTLTDKSKLTRINSNPKIIKNKKKTNKKMIKEEKKEEKALK